MEKSHLEFFFFEIFEYFILFFGFSKGLASNTKVNPNIEKQQLPGNGAKNLFGKKQSFNICKPQVQGTLLSTWGVVRKKLCFQLPKFTRAYQSRQNQRWREVKLTTKTKKTSIVIKP